MINKNFIFTNHANDRFEERFPHLVKEVELSSIVFCNKDEITRIHNTKAYKNLKKSKRSRFHYYKNDNNVYFLCEAKKQTNHSNSYANVVATVIDFTEENSSLIDDDFKMQMIQAEYRLIELNKRVLVNEKIKKKKKKKKNIIIKEIKTKKTYLNKKTTLLGKLERVVEKTNNCLLYKGYDIVLDFEKIQHGNIKYLHSCLTLITKSYGKVENFINLINEIDFDKNNKEQDLEHSLKVKKELISFGYEMIKENVDFDLSELKELKPFFTELVLDVLKTKVKGLSYFYSDDQNIEHNEYKKLFSYFMELHTSDDSFKTKELMNFMACFLFKHQRNIEIDYIYNSDPVINNKRLYVNLLHLNIINLNIEAPKDKKLITPILDFYNLIIKQNNNAKMN